MIYTTDVIPERPSRGSLGAPAAAGDDDLTVMEKGLLKHISSIPVSVDELVELSGRPVDRLAEVLLSLELKGRIRMVPGQQYVANN